MDEQFEEYREAYETLDKLKKQFTAVIEDSGGSVIDQKRRDILGQAMVILSDEMRHIDYDEFGKWLETR